MIMLIQLIVPSITLLVVLLMVAAFKRIPEGHVYSLHRFGRPARMLDAGVHLVLPLVDRVAHKISLSGHVMQLELPASQYMPALAGIVYWQVLEPERVDAVIDQAEDLIRSTTVDALLQHAAPLTDEVPVARNARLKQMLNQQLRQRGVLITRVDLAQAA